MKLFTIFVASLKISLAAAVVSFPMRHAGTRLPARTLEVRQGNFPINTFNQVVS